MKNIDGSRIKQMGMHGPEIGWRLSKPYRVLCAVTAIGAVVGLGMALTPPYVVLMCVLAAVATLIFLTEPKAFVVILLVTRPSWEAFKDVYMPTPLGDMLNPAGMVTIALVVGLAVWVVVRRVNLVAYSLSYPYLAFLLVCLVSALLSPVIAAAIGEWLRFLSYFLLYIFVRESSKDYRDISRLTMAVILSSIAPIVVGLHQITTNQVLVFYGISQIRSLFSHMNGYGIFLTMVGIPILMAFISAPQRTSRYGYGILLMLLLYSLLRTYARTAWGGFILAAVVIAVAEYRSWFLILPPALLAVWLWGPNVQARIMLAFGSMDVEHNSLATRLLLWQEALSLFRSSPLWGTGLRSFNVLNEYWAGRYSALAGVQVHNTYMQFLAETGLLGLGSFLWLQVVMAWEAWQGLRSVRDPRLRPIVLAFAGVFVANLAMGMTDNLISSPVIQWYFWTFAALAGCAIELQARQWEHSEGV